MKKIFRLILLLVFCASLANAEESPPAVLLRQVEDSVGSLDFSNRLQTNLELGHYYDVLGKPEQADKFYEGVISSLWDANPQETAANAHYVDLLLKQLETVKRPLNADGRSRASAPHLSDLASQYRAQLIRKALEESDDKAVQNGDLRAVGAESAATLAEQLSLAPEFKDLFRVAVESLPVTRNASVSHAQNLASLVAAQYRDDEGSSPAEDKSQPCWNEQRVLFNDDTIKSFTCTGASIAAGESDLASKENYSFIQTLLCEKPFAEVTLSCSITFHIQDRKLAIEKAALEKVKKRVKEKCEIPPGLQKLAESEKSAEDSEQKLPELAPTEGRGLKKETCEDMDDTLFFSALPQGPSLRCEDFILQLKMEKGKDAQERIFAQVEECKASAGKGGCFEKLDKLAAALDDPYRIPMLLIVARDGLESLSFNQAKSFEQRLMSNVTDFAMKSSPGVKDLILNQIDDSLARYLAKAWKSPDPADKIQGFVDAAKMAESVGDPGVKARLQLHVLEKFGELGSPNTHFSEGMMGLPTAKDLEASEDD